MNLRPLLALLIPLCAYASDERVAYTCDNNMHIDISYSADASGRPQATLHFADEAMVLPQVPAASGALYRSGDIRLHTRGNEALFEDGKNNLRRCTRGSIAPVPPQPAPQATSSSFIDITGSVTYLARIALPPDAVLSIRLQAGRRTLVEQRYDLNGAQVPIPFSATVDRDLIGKKQQVTVSARITSGGQLLFVSDKGSPALVNGQAVPISIRMSKVSRPHAR
jgi:putative lipoprotein